MTHGVKRVYLRVAAFAAISVLFCTLFTMPAQAAINPQINFQGKLTNPDGTNVTNGNYSIRFRLYTDPSADAAVACGAGTATCKWEETQATVAVSDGIFQVALGSSTALPGSVDFNTAGIYLGVKVGADAEMTPRIRFTASPYAFNSDRLNGLASSAFGQLTANNSFTGTNTIQGTSATQFVVQNATNAVFLVDTSTQKVVVGPAALTTGAGILAVGTDTLVASGGISFGSDGNLYRSGVNELSTDDSFKVKGTSIAIGTGTGIGTLTTWNGGNAFWIDMPTTGPSGIGSGGPGANAWIAFAQGAGNYFTDAAAGDIVYRNQSGRLLFGVTAGLSNMMVSGTNIQIGQATTDATAVLLTLDTYNNATDPAGTVGAQYYNTARSKFRCFEGAAWRDCITLSTRSFVDTTADAVIDAETTSYWDVAAQNNNSFPNLTPSLAAKSVWVTVSAQLNSTGIGDTEFIGKIERTIGGAAPAACNAGTLVANFGTFTTNTNAKPAATVQFMDAPATTSKVWYNICSDGDTAGTTATINRLDVTLLEVDNLNN